MRKSIEKDDGSRSIKQLKQAIFLKKVGYRYPAAKCDTLKDIEINFKKGDMVAIVGPSGSGKSTLIDLIPRLRTPTSGSISFDGEDIKKFSLKDVRQLISYAPQSSQIFNGTIKSHILYGKSDATDNEIDSAVQLSGAKDFIDNLPNKFDTKVGEDAVKLSGGQRQRLDLARALVKKSDILILDEPSSNLDAEAEEAFNQAIVKIRRETNITIIVVVHRLSNIVDADQIVVLNQGRVEAIGLHNDLLKQEGWYAKAWKMQEKRI
jgi:ABC-type multidrug transport system fused ATPase/permease subunit